MDSGRIPTAVCYKSKPLLIIFWVIGIYFSVVVCRFKRNYTIKLNSCCLAQLFKSGNVPAQSIQNVFCRKIPIENIIKTVHIFVRSTRWKLISLPPTFEHVTFQNIELNFLTVSCPEEILQAFTMLSTVKKSFSRNNYKKYSKFSSWR